MDTNELTKLVNKHDPAGLLKIGAPKDEYEMEIGEIGQKLSSCKSVDELTQFVHDKFFPINVEDGVNPNWDKLRALANDLWEFQQQQ